VRVGLAAYGDTTRTIFDLDDYVTKNDIKAQIEGAVQNVSSSSDQRTAKQKKKQLKTIVLKDVYYTSVITVRCFGLNIKR
jgi:hypothetical protein